MTLNKLSMHFGVGIAYAALYAVCRNASFAHWMPIAGLRIAALMLLRYGFWPTLAIADSLATGIEESSFIDGLSLPILIFERFPIVTIAMPFMAAYKHWSPDRSAPRWYGFMACALAVSFCFTAWGLAAQWLIFQRYDYVTDFVGLACKYFVGFYLGILALASPFFVVLAELPRVRFIGDEGWIASSKGWLSELVVAAVACIIIAACVRQADITAMRYTAYIIIFCAMLRMSIRHGWRGASLMCASSSFALIVMMPDKYDTATLVAQTALALIASTILLLCPRIAEERQAVCIADATPVLSLAREHIKSLKDGRDR